MSRHDAALAAEAEVIGAALNDPTRVRELAHLRPEHFVSALYGRVWRLIGEAAEEGREVTPAALANWLDAEDPELIGAGGVDHLFDLLDQTPTWVRARSSADAVLEAYTRRSAEMRVGAGLRELKGLKDGSAVPVIGRLREDLERLESGSDPAGRSAVSAQAAATEALDELDAEAAAGDAAGRRTGLSCFDRRLRGLRPGRLIVIGGRPAMGKTALARVAAYGCARRNPDAAVLFFSLEMSRREITERALSEASFLARRGVPYADMGPSLDPEDRRALRGLIEALPANLVINDAAGLSVEEVRRSVWAAKAKSPVAAVFIDYLQLMERPPAYGRNDAAVIGEMTQRLKRIARETATCIVVLSQLSRQVEGRPDRRPQLSDLRESGAIEQDADAVLFPYREVYYLQKAEPEASAGLQAHRDWELEVELAFRRMDVHAAKVRQGAEGRDRLEAWIEYDHIADAAESYA